MAKQASLTTITSTNNNAATLNSNFNALNTALTNTLSRDGSTPNTMTADLDLNENDIINVKSIDTGLIYINGLLVNSIGNLANWAGTWATTTSYDTYDIVFHDDGTTQAIYRCLVAHTSGTFVTDRDTNAYWEVYIGGDYVIDQANAKITGGSITGITDLAVADGGTGSSTAAGARTNLGVAIGSNVQAWDADLDSLSGVTDVSNLTDVGNLSLTNGDILYVSGGVITRLPVGSNTQVLTVTAGAPAWAAAAGGGGGTRTVIGTYDLSVNTLDAGNEIDIDVSTYDKLEFILTDGTVGSSDVVIVRVSDDAGVSFDAGASDYKRHEFSDAAATNNVGVSWMRLSGGSGTAELSCFAEMRGLNDANVKTMLSGYGASSTGSVQYQFYRDVKQADDYIRVTTLNGNAMTAGTLQIVGIA